jgi:hypothetical protein
MELPEVLLYQRRTVCGEEVGKGRCLPQKVITVLLKAVPVLREYLYKVTFIATAVGKGCLGGDKTYIVNKVRPYSVDV